MFSLKHPPPSLATAEHTWAEFTQARLGTTSLAELRAKSAEELLAATMKEKRPDYRADIDGYVLPHDMGTIYSRGDQAHVPLLAGWNRDEGSAADYFGGRPQTLANFRAIARERFGNRADEFLKVYRAATDAEAQRAAADLEGDDFIAYSTWKWIDLHRQTSGHPVYRYEFDQPLPPGVDSKPDFQLRVPHASDIEFVFEALDQRHIPWTPTWSPADRRVSEMMATYWTNFAKTGNPNGPGLAQWPEYNPKSGFEVLHIKADPDVQPDQHRARYLFLEQYYKHPAAAQP